MVEGVLLKINCGSGQRPFKPPFINVDVNPKWNPDFVADGANMPMFANDSADLIVSHHVAEHAGCGDSAPMFNECRRVLTPGGSLIVCVPDMRALAEAWIAGRLTTQIYLTNVYGAFLDSDVSTSILPANISSVLTLSGIVLTIIFPLPPVESGLLRLAGCLSVLLFKFRFVS